MEFSMARRKYTFHLLGLVHLPVSKRYAGCAFTQKIVKLSTMLMSLGHDVILYGAEGSDAECTKFVQTHTLNDIRDEWGDGDNRFDVGYDWRRHGFRHDFNTKRADVTHKYYQNTSNYILDNASDDDFLLVTQGYYQKPIADAANLYLTCEPGIGYRGSFARFRAFESSYLQNFTYGSEHPFECINGNYYDRVIPNYFDPNDFPYSPETKDYYLYIGRMIERKGVMTAVKVVEHLDAKLILAGQGNMTINSPNCEFVGYVDPKERAELMRHAIATFVPTLYLEAFGGVHIESMLCGTPPITTNFGVFPGTIQHGVNGYLCNTLNDFVIAARGARGINRGIVRKHGERYIMDNVKLEYQAWFDDLYRLYESSKDATKKAWHWVGE